MRARPPDLRKLAPCAVLALVVGGCSMPFHHKPPTSPAPPPVAATPPDTTHPAPADTTHATKHALGLPATHKNGNRTPALADSLNPTAQPVTPVEAMSVEERQRSLSRTVADTTTAGQAVRRCANRALQPDQDATADAVRSLLAQTRAALGSGELWRAESLARKARQLASSLDCP
ncbi:MAG TPA: hypothetical protein VLV15_11410 [Dongiaceae bacterium]|nr:hypothetical protein [Dongiaceae bacterium]